MRTVLTTNSDEAFYFGKMAFQIVVRESVRYMLTGALLVGAWWGSYRFFGESIAWGLGIIVVPMLVFGIPLMFAEDVQGSISNLLRGKVGKQFLGFGPEPTESSARN